MPRAIDFHVHLPSSVGFHDHDWYAYQKCTKVVCYSFERRAHQKRTKVILTVSWSKRVMAL
jgi:hypothetical protein